MNKKLNLQYFIIFCCILGTVYFSSKVFFERNNNEKQRKRAWDYINNKTNNITKPTNSIFTGPIIFFN